MSEQCSYERDGRYEVKDLWDACHGLLTRVETLQQELADLTQYCRMLRDRVDANEMAVPR